MLIETASRISWKTQVTNSLTFITVIKLNLNSAFPPRTWWAVKLSELVCIYIYLIQTVAHVFSVSESCRKVEWTESFRGQPSLTMHAFTVVQIVLDFFCPDSNRERNVYRNLSFISKIQIQIQILYL